jgi:uncharacterized membrane protein
VQLGIKVRHLKKAAHFLKERDRPSNPSESICSETSGKILIAMLAGDEQESGHLSSGLTRIFYIGHGDDFFARKQHAVSRPSFARLLPEKITTYCGKIIIWILLLAYAAGVAAAAGTPSPFAQLVALAGILIAFAHAVLAYGRTLALVFLGLCLLVTFSIENLGVATGFPFGHYHFDVAPSLPYIGAVPVVAGPLYFAMGYFSWSIASILLGEADLRLDRPFYRVALPIVAAFVMVQWDVVMDPPNATLGHAWVWHDGGGYFGVPLTNFLGWYLTVWLFYQAFAFVWGA